MGRTCHCAAGDPDGHVHLLSGPPHEPGCLGNHLGDCAVSGMFEEPLPPEWEKTLADFARDPEVRRLQVLLADAREMLHLTVRRIAAALDLHRPRTDRPDAGCIQCGQVYPCATVRVLREGD